jgi:hypothetical protein
MITTETVRQYDPRAGEWRTVEVQITPEPRRRRASQRRAPRHGAPRDLTGLSDGSPLPSWWRDTAYAPSDGFADTRTFIKRPAMKTRRAAVVMPADAGQLTARKPTDRLDA